MEWKLLHENAIMPTKGTPQSAGWDLYALESYCIPPTKDCLESCVCISSPGLTPVRTGIAVQLPLGTYGRIAGRSGLCFRTGLIVTAGVIDVDYTDELKVLFVNPTNHSIHLKAGERIAQLIVEKIYVGDAQVVTEFSRKPDVEHKGFGSTGQ